MTGAHLHLMVNHVSLFALGFGAIALAASMKRKSVDLRMLAAFLFLTAGVFGWIASATGEEAEDVIKALALGGESLVEQHEQAAEWAVRSCTWVALLALATEWIARKKKRWLKAAQWTLLVFAIHGCTVFAATAFLGGQIRHTEVRDEAKPEAP